MIRPQPELPDSERHALPVRPIRGVLVYYQPSRVGRAALSHGLALADDAGASLTVAAVTPQDRTDVGRDTAGSNRRRVRSLPRHDCEMERADAFGRA